MALKYGCFKNKVTGQVCYFPAGRYGNFLSAIKKIVNYVRYNIPKYYIAHVILTVAENVSEIDFQNVHRVLNFISRRLERAGSDFIYVIVKELQERGAVHYHILCIYSKSYVFPSFEDIHKSWRLGFVKITAPKLRMRMQKIAGYIGKYIGKGYEYEQLNVRKSFSASQIKQIYKLSADRLSSVFDRFGKKVAEGFACTYRKVFLVGYEISEILGKEVQKPFKDLIMEFPSDWLYQGIHDSPF